jgi:hypothetical protein
VIMIDVWFKYKIIDYAFSFLYDQRDNLDLISDCLIIILVMSRCIIDLFLVTMYYRSKVLTHV